MLAAMDSCFGLFGPHQHGKAKKQAQVLTEDKAETIPYILAQFYLW